jgi:hypothetical protein
LIENLYKKVRSKTAEFKRLEVNYTVGLEFDLKRAEKHCTEWEMRFRENLGWEVGSNPPPPLSGLSISVLTSNAPIPRIDGGK